MESPPWVAGPIVTTAAILGSVDHIVTGQYGKRVAGWGYQMSSDNFRAGAQVIASMGLTLEGWMYFPQMFELAEFAKAVPDLTIILNHIGGLLRVGPYSNSDETLPTWRGGSAPTW